MRLARVFGDYMVLQRRMPVRIWGVSSGEKMLEVKINGEKVCEEEIREGEFSFYIPPQEAAENVTLEIGAICLQHVDIGEVWIAGGQSNMEFMLQYTKDGEEEIAHAFDEHLRMYTVGQYSYKDEREAGYKAWNPWDKWYPYTTDTAKEMSAVAVYFAKELRKKGIPVGILSCNLGGTSASAWIDKSYLLQDTQLKTYVDDFEALTAALDLERFYAIKKIVRPAMASQMTKKTMSAMLKNTFKPGEMEKMMAAGQRQQDVSQMPPEAVELAKLPLKDLLMVGPGDPNEPGALYEYMVKEIIGYSAKGVIWYQGESDEEKADIYAKLFSAMISCWRSAWKEQNVAMESLPFLFVQLAPYGMWRDSTGEKYPILRSQQELVAENVEDVYMTSISDIGNIYDIHPKVKAPVGYRLALLAEKYVYTDTDMGEPDILADAPEAVRMEKKADKVRILFLNGEGLYKKRTDFSTYNGFAAEEIDAGLLPPVLDGINGLCVLADSVEVTDARCVAEEDVLCISSDAFIGAKEIKVEFAQTGFYQVNLYNKAGIPVKPFRKEFRA